MATVYLAEQAGPGGFRKRVALKIIKPDLAEDETFIKMLMREAAIGGMLRHPNIVQTLSFEQFDGRYVLVLEFVDGHTVSELLDEARGKGGGLPSSVALDVAIQTCRGLSYAHRVVDDAGKPLVIVHRDLKPANLMRSQHGVVKIMDFGIARATASWAALTAQGVVRGTPSYMSPEQVLGKELDGRSDIFCLGAILYEMVTSKVLFKGASMVKVMEKIARVEIGTAIDEVDSLVSGAGPLLRRALAPHPDDRYADAMEFADELKALLLGSGKAGVKPPRTVARMAALEDLSGVTDLGKMSKAGGNTTSLDSKTGSKPAPRPPEDDPAPKKRKKKKRKKKKKRRQEADKKRGGLSGFFGFGKKKDGDKKKRRKAKADSVDDEFPDEFPDDDDDDDVEEFIFFEEEEDDLPPPPPSAGESGVMDMVFDEDTGQTIIAKAACHVVSVDGADKIVIVKGAVQVDRLGARVKDLHVKPFVVSWECGIQ